MINFDSTGIPPNILKESARVGNDLLELFLGYSKLYKEREDNGSIMANSILCFIFGLVARITKGDEKKFQEQIKQLTDEMVEESKKVRFTITRSEN